MLPATTAFRASETQPNISVYHARVTALEIRLDHLEGENEETEVRYLEVVAENAALREQLTEVEALKADAHSLIQEMRTRLITAEARSQESNKKHTELRALVHALEAEKTGLLQAKRSFICSHRHSYTDRVNGSAYSQLSKQDNTRTSYLSTPSIAAPENTQGWTNPCRFYIQNVPHVHSLPDTPPIFHPPYRKRLLPEMNIHQFSTPNNGPLRSSDRLLPIHELKYGALLPGATTC